MPVSKSSVVRTIALIVVVSLPLSALVGGLAGYLLGRRVVVQQPDGTTAPIEQVVKVEESSATIDAVNKVAPAVVSIIGEAPAEQSFDLENVGGAGSGFILTSDGLIATNRHVVADDALDYTVVLADGRTFVAEIVDLDPTFDFAIVRIKATNLPIVELGSSDDLQIGESVIAIGNAFGELQNTVTAGVISARNRTIIASDGFGQATEQLEGLLQTDAAINPGNSGGPLVNLGGKVVGVNTATDVTGENLGFAIPIDEAKVAIESVIDTGKIERPLLGVRYINLTKDLAELNELTEERGAYVTAEANQQAVLKGSPAARLGIKKGDVIKKINDDEVTPEHSLAAILRKYKPGDEITVTWLSREQEKSEKVTLDTIAQ